MTSRRKTRELALSCTYEIEVGNHDIETVLDRTIESQDVQSPARTFLRDSVNLVYKYREAVDKLIEELAVGWKLKRVARVDLAILRLAIVELIFGIEDPSPPDPIIINEAVVLAKKFSTEDSGKFINGILASVLKNRDEYRKRLSAEE